MDDVKNKLTLAVDMGVALLENGAEIYRVNDSVNYILKAYGVKDYHVFVIPSGIFASAAEDTEEACSVVRVCSLGSIHLKRIVLLNQISRDIVAHPCNLDNARRRLEEAKSDPPFPTWFQCVASGIGVGGIMYLLNASLFDSVLAFAIGFFLRFYSMGCAKMKFRSVMINMTGSFLVTMFAFLISRIHPDSSMDNLVISGIYAMIPGTMFTTAVRDLFNSDYLSGWIHLIDALLGAVELAAGVAIAFHICECLTLANHSLF